MFQRCFCSRWRACAGTTPACSGGHWHSITEATPPPMARKSVCDAGRGGEPDGVALSMKHYRLPRSSYLQVVESSRIFTLGDSAAGALQVHVFFCLWCNACDYPASHCICKHVIVGRIGYLRDRGTRKLLWRDSLLCPITQRREPEHEQGREHELYSSTSISEALVTSTGNTDDSYIDCKSSSDSESDRPQRPPRGFIGSQSMPVCLCRHLRTYAHCKASGSQAP